MSKLRTHADVWSTVYSYRNNKKWIAETDCPLRLRGYMELVLSDLPGNMRRKIDTALKRGYRLEMRTNLPEMLELICHNNPIADIHIGYIGKTKLTVHMPTKDAAEGLADELRAVSVLSGVISKSVIHTCRYRSSDSYVVVANPGSRNDTDKYDPFAYLKPCFTELRSTIDRWLAEHGAATRESIARWAATDASVIRIPFDSYKDRNQ